MTCFRTWLPTVDAVPPVYGAEGYPHYDFRRWRLAPPVIEEGEFLDSVGCLVADVDVTRPSKGMAAGAWIKYDSRAGFAQFELMVSESPF